MFYFFPSPPIRSGEAFSSVVFSSLLSLLLFVFFSVAMAVWKGKPAFVCDHGFERSDLCCAEIIIIIIIIIIHTLIIFFDTLIILNNISCFPPPTNIFTLT